VEDNGSDNNHKAHHDSSSIKKIVDSQNTQPASFKLKCRLLFEPLRNFNASLEVVIVMKNRGRWRLTLDIYATDPIADDTIVLTAPIGGIDKVTFKICNRFLGYSTFQAYFSNRSSQFFTISPSNGVLASFGSEGTQFVVTYAPTAYGSRDFANLVISTDEAQWNYKIIGQYPNDKIGGGGSGSTSTMALSLPHSLTLKK
jgi:hypothetical protein